MKTCWVLLLLVFLSGCESLSPEGGRRVLSDICGGRLFEQRRTLVEKSVIPDFSDLEFLGRLSFTDVPVEVDFSGCAVTAIITKDTLWGTTVGVASVPIQSILKKVFARTSKGVFRDPVDDEQPSAKIKVSTYSVIIKKLGGSVQSAIGLKVDVFASGSRMAEPIYSDSFSGMQSASWNGGNEVPDGVYKSAEDVVCQFLKMFSGDQVAVDRILRPYQTAPASVTGLEQVVAKRKAELLKLSFSSGFGEVVKGSCEIACNDWDAPAAKDWGERQIRKGCESKLGIEGERVRVIYDGVTYSHEGKRWAFSFSAFARAKMVLDYDENTRIGTCTADVELLRMPETAIADAIREYVVKVMRDRGGVVQDGKSCESAIRFGEFRTDTRYNLIRCSFELVY